MSVTVEESKSGRNAAVNDLKQLLSNSYVLYVKTQNFHWNVTGPRFQQLHEFFQAQYTELADAIDEIAEQIRILKGRPPSSMSEFLQIATLQESNESLDENGMLNALLIDHDKMIIEITHFIESAQKAGDEGTADLFIQRLRVHDKTSWMIRSHL